MLTISDQVSKARVLSVEALKFHTHIFDLYLNSDFDKRLQRIQSRVFQRWVRRDNEFNRLYDLLILERETQNSLESFSNDLTNSGDSVRLPASASEAVERDGSTGQGGNQTPKTKILDTVPEQHLSDTNDGHCPICGCFVNYGSWCTRCKDVTTKPQCEHHSVHDLFCCCDKCCTVVTLHYEMLIP